VPSNSAGAKFENHHEIFEKIERKTFCLHDRLGYWQTRLSTKYHVPNSFGVLSHAVSDVFWTSKMTIFAIMWIWPSVFNRSDKLRYFIFFRNFGSCIKVMLFTLDLASYDRTSFSPEIKKPLWRFGFLRKHFKSTCFYMIFALQNQKFLWNTWHFLAKLLLKFCKWLEVYNFSYRFLKTFLILFSAPICAISSLCVFWNIWKLLQFSELFSYLMTRFTISAELDIFEIP